MRRFHVFRMLAAGLALALLGRGAALAESCHPQVDPERPQYFVGYGSLMQTASKRRTAPNTGVNLPVMVSGYERAWNTRGSKIGFSTTYLGVRPEPGATMAAALYRTFALDDIAATDAREAYYCREAVDPAAIRMLDGSAAPEGGQIWIYINKPDAVFPPDADFPIVQSYVDIFLGGCLELAEKVVGQNIDFAEQCVTTTAGWSGHWVNDRLHPRRPFAAEPMAGRIDALLHRLVPEAFGSIRIE